MSSLRSAAHCAATLAQVDARKAFDFLADGMNQTYWALGSWDRRQIGDRTFVGTSLFDGRELVVRLVPDEERLLVDFETGRSPDSLQHAVEARVVPGPTLGHPEGTCVVTLTVWRGADVDDAAWELLWHCFETEIQMIRGRLELGF